MTSRTVTKDEWKAKGIELFGSDQERWKFHCPHCGREESITSVRAEFPLLKGCGWRPESECIGRYTPLVGCDWTAWGLFSGPLFVTVEEGKTMPAFDFAGEPFTATPRETFVAVDNPAAAPRPCQEVVHDEVVTTARRLCAIEDKVKCDGDSDGSLEKERIDLEKRIHRLARLWWDVFVAATRDSPLPSGLARKIQDGHASLTWRRDPTP